MTTRPGHKADPEAQPDNLLRWCDVDQVIECVDIPCDIERKFLWHLLCAGVQPYAAGGVGMADVWGLLNEDVKIGLNEAYRKDVGG